MKKLPPKKLFYRILLDGSISFGEYISGKWRNICDPIQPEEVTVWRHLKKKLDVFKQRTGRSYLLVPYSPARTLDKEKIKELLSQ